MDAVLQLSATVGIQAACGYLNVSRATLYRLRPVQGPAAADDQPSPVLAVRPSPPRTLTAGERSAVLDVLHEERFQDSAPAAIQATLLDEGRYLCSVRTMYRILDQEGESHERRKQREHPPYWKPELLAISPNQLWWCKS